MADGHAIAAPRGMQQLQFQFEPRSANFKHGLTGLAEYRAWQTMRLRCTNPANAAYPNYGARGIRVCEEWRDDFLAFLSHMGRKPTRYHELDRINNDGHYEPGNCRWVLRKINDRNRRNNRWLECFGQRKVLAQWCEELQMPIDTVSKRLSAGWSPEEALSIPVNPKRPNGSVASDRATQVLKRPHRQKIEPEREAEVVRLVRDGLTNDEICARTGVGWNTIGRILKRRGVARTERTPKAES